MQANLHFKKKKKSHRQSMNDQTFSQNPRKRGKCHHHHGPQRLTFTWWVCCSLFFDRNQPSTTFYSVLVSISVFIALSTIFHFINSPDNSPLSHCSSSLISALMVLSAIYLFMKVSFSPEVILLWLIGLKARTN